MSIPKTVQGITVCYSRPGVLACDIALPTGTALARVHDGRTIEYTVADPNLLRRLAGDAYHPNQPYCFVPDEAASEAVYPEEGRIIAVEPSLLVAWSEATYGFFDPASHCVDCFGSLPNSVQTGAGCRALFGQRIPAERCRWEDGDYSLYTGLNGLMLQVRPRSPNGHGRVLGYAITPVLARAIDREIRLHHTETGEKMEAWNMPDGSLSRRAADSLDRSVDVLASGCGMERIMEHTMNTGVTPR